MKAVALSRHLAVFDGSPVRTAVEPPRAAPALEEIKKAHEQAWQEGYRRGRSESEAALVAQKEALESDYARRLEQEQARWRNDMIAPLSEQIKTGFETLEIEMAEAVAEVLDGVIAERRRQKIVDAFLSCVRDILADGAAATFRLEAPVELIDKLSVQSLFEGRFVDIRPAKDDEIQAKLDRSIVRTRLKAWSQDVTAAARSPS